MVENAKDFKDSDILNMVLLSVRIFEKCETSKSFHPIQQSVAMPITDLRGTLP